MSPVVLVPSVSVPRVTRDRERVRALRVLVVTVLVSRRPARLARRAVVRAAVVSVTVPVACRWVCEWTRRLTSAVTAMNISEVIAVATTMAGLLISTITGEFELLLARGRVKTRR